MDDRGIRAEGPLPLLIFPLNGNGIEALDCLGQAHELLGFVTDGEPDASYVALGVPVSGREALRQYPQARVLAVPGSASSFRQRRQVVEGLGIEPARFATVVHPTACISPRAHIGHNVLIMAGVVVTANAVIGDHVCILPHSVVHHDSHIGNWTLLGSHVTVAGHTRVGRNCYVGSGSTLRDGLVIGDGTLVGLGSCVLRDTEPGSVVAGHPARVLPAVA
jgi:sugar O-acyltransferase (sialic acid O-acetyltransferase NeuD family)